MKLIKYWILTMAIPLLFACKNDNQTDDILSSKTDSAGTVELSQEEIVSIAFDNPQEIAPEEIMKLVQEFPLKANDKGETKISDVRDIAVGEKYYISSGERRQKASKGTQASSSLAYKVPFYKVNLKTGTGSGLAIVCADERFPRVVAYIPLKDRSEEAFSGAAGIMLNYAEMLTVAQIDRFNSIRDSLRETTLKKIGKQTMGLSPGNLFQEIKSKIRIKGVAGISGLPYLPSPVLGIIGPLTQVDWDQEGTYNQKLPASNCNGIAGFYPAGCSIVAAAQILSFFEPSMTVKDGSGSNLSVNWPYLKQTRMILNNAEPAKKEMIGYLIKDIFEGCQATPDCGGSAASTSKVEGYLRRYINIENSTSFDVNACKASLDNLRLVMASGTRNKGTQDEGRHAWVVDGYAVCQRPAREIIKRYDFYLHCNLGWSGNESGWFMVNQDLSITFPVYWDIYVYDQDLRCSPHARRK